MKKIILTAGLCLATVASYAAELRGQEAKDLYLALDSLDFREAKNYSFLIQADRISCETRVQGPYNIFSTCNIIDHLHPTTNIKLRDVLYARPENPSFEQGARKLYLALKGISEKDPYPENQLVVTKTAQAKCLLESPVGPPDNNVASHFSCELIDSQ